MRIRKANTGAAIFPTSNWPTRNGKAMTAFLYEYVSLSRYTRPELEQGRSYTVKRGQDGKWSSDLKCLPSS
jgi:hypothetical protein